MKLTGYCIAVLLPLFCYDIGCSQELHSGQLMPAYSTDLVTNYKSNDLNFNDFKGKLVVFDFWGFYCTACLKRFAELDSLQNEFSNKIQIILVNRDSLKDTKNFLQTHSRLTVPKQIPFITTDTLLHTLFPHSGVPSYVWIDTSGKILYRTDQYLSKQSIIKYLNGDRLEIPKNVMSRYIPTLFDTQYQHTIQYATYISKTIDSVYMHIDYDDDNIPYDSRSIEDLFQFAYNESEVDGYYKFREPGRTILKVTDSIQYTYLPRMDYDVWRCKYAYYYHAMLPARLQKDKYKIMQEDLQRYFNMNVMIEKRPVECLVLVRTSSKDKLKTTGGTTARTDFSDWLAAKDGDSEHPPIRFLKNVPFSDLFNVIKGYEYYFNTMILDSSGYSGKIDFKMNEDVLKNLTIENLANELKKYDLDLIRKQVVIDVLVLSENNKQE